MTEDFSFEQIDPNQRRERIAKNVFDGMLRTTRSAAGAHNPEVCISKTIDTMRTQGDIDTDFDTTDLRALLRQYYNEAYRQAA